MAAPDAPITSAELRAIRASLGLSRDDMAAMLAVSTRTVEQWEAGRRQPAPYLRRALADVEREMTTHQESRP